MIIDDKSVLLIDVQTSFLPGGNLAVREGDQVIPVINRLAGFFAHVVLTQDWYRRTTCWSLYPCRQKHVRQHYVALRPPVLWPDHCVQGTAGADIATDIAIPHAQLIIRKGYHRHIDSYSAFFEADRETPTGLRGYLTECGLETVFVSDLPPIFASHGPHWTRGAAASPPM